MHILLFQKFLSIYNCNLIIKFAKNVCINNASFLYNLAESRYFKCVATIPTILILSIKIIIFGIANLLIVKDIRRSNFSKLDFLISIIIYVIFGQFNNILYSCINLQNCKDLQTYFNTLGKNQAIFFLKTFLTLNQICFINNYIYWLSTKLVILILLGILPKRRIEIK